MSDDISGSSPSDAGKLPGDVVLGPLLEEALHDPSTLGIILHGSRGAGMGDAMSDYDLLWVLTDQAYDRRVEAGEPLEETTMRTGRKFIEIAYTCPRCLADPATPEWVIQGLATGQVLFDTAGEVTASLAALLTIPEDKACANAAEMFDAYLNAFYRSIKAARRGNELGSRLQAAESIIYLIRTLFALERRWPPFHDRLARALDGLHGQDWKSGELQHLALTIVKTADPRLQIQLEERVEALLRRRGYGEVIDAWDGEIERARTLQ